MTNSQLQLWQRLSEFNIDDGNPALSFTARLARENGWDMLYAARVVDEYKRFLFLAITAGHTVTPSEQVDQAWHLHLAYTHSYWDRLCNQVLGKPLHHNPTAGGRDESRKFKDLYRRSIRSYHHAFGTMPPADIWPDAATRFGSDLDACRINTHENWVIPKRAGRIGLSACIVLIFIMLGAVLGLKAPRWDPRGWVVLMVLVLICGFALATLLRRRLRTPDDDGEATIDELDTYDIAYLAGGKRRAMDAAIAGTVASGAVRLEENHKLSVDGPLPLNPHRLEETIVRHLEAGPRRLNEVRVNLSLSMNQTVRKLEELGLAPTSMQRFKMRIATLLLMFGGVIPLAIACLSEAWKAKVHAGGWPWLIFVSVVLTLTVLMRAPLRTLRGDRVLKQLQMRNDHLLALRSREDVPPELLPLGVALFGAAVLTGTAYASLGNDLSVGKSSWSSGCGGGCGTSSGGGDGGGGCGGGGCGGGCGGCGCGD